MESATSAERAPAPMSVEELRAEVERNPLWYHTMELAPGVVTPGWFDLRPVVDRLPWPDVRGKRCLDIGTYDGFLAFELERRGAAEVTATDISDHAGWDWPPHMRSYAPEQLAAIAGPEKGLGFRIAKRALGSAVERLELSVYDLDPERIGKFDVVVCGSLLLHLRDPLRALDAIRTVCGGVFMSCEEVRLELTALYRRKPLAELNEIDDLCQWWVPNVAGHKRMLTASGFDIERTFGPYAIPFGPAHPPRMQPLRKLRQRILLRAMTGGDGLTHASVLARPRV